MKTSIKIEGQDVPIESIRTALGEDFSLVSAEALQTEIDGKLAAQKSVFEEQKSKIEIAHGQTWKDRMQGVEGTLNGLGFSQNEGETGVQYAQRIAKDFSELKKTLAAEKLNTKQTDESVKADLIDFESKYKEELDRNKLSNAKIEQSNAAMKALQDSLTSLNNDAALAKKDAYTKSFIDKIKFNTSLTDGTVVAFKQLATDALNKEYDGIKDIDGTTFFEKGDNILPTFNAETFLNSLAFIKENLFKERTASGVNSIEDLNKLKSSKAEAKADYPLTVNPTSVNDIVKNGVELGINKKDHKAMAEYLKKHPEFVAGKLKVDRF